MTKDFNLLNSQQRRELQQFDRKMNDLQRSMRESNQQIQQSQQRLEAFKRDLDTKINTSKSRYGPDWQHESRFWEDGHSSRDINTVTGEVKDAHTTLHTRIKGFLKYFNWQGDKSGWHK